MKTIKKKYIVNDKNKKIAVQLDIKTFNKIEEIMENYSLHYLMNEDKDNASLKVNEAKQYYSKLKKSN